VNPFPKITLVTERAFGLARTLDVIRQAALALGPRRLLVQYRDKVASPEERKARFSSLQEVARAVDARLIVNGSPAEATAFRADGVHVPMASAGQVDLLRQAVALFGQDAYVTTTAHTDDDVLRAAELGAHAIFVSPVFSTPGKGAPCGVAALASARRVVSASGGGRIRPRIIALGGVTPNAVVHCVQAGADGIAVIRALYEASDPGRCALALAAPFAPLARGSPPPK
jgi:thiamine-phosphate diphosphorylase